MEKKCCREIENGGIGQDQKMSEIIDGTSYTQSLDDLISLAFCRLNDCAEFIPGDEDPGKLDRIYSVLTGLLESAQNEITRALDIAAKKTGYIVLVRASSSNKKHQPGEFLNAYIDGRTIE